MLDFNAIKLLSAILFSRLWPHKKQLSYNDFTTIKLISYFSIDVNIT